LDNQPDIDCRDDQDATPLLLACLADHEDTVRALLVRGANPDHVAEKSYLYRAIHIAAQNGSQSLVALLLKFGASENVRLEDQATPLHLAASWSTGQEGFSQVARTLLRVGIDVDARNEDGATPLHLAIKRDDEKMVQVLVDFDADVDILDGSDHSPLYYAVKDHSKFTNILWNSGPGFVETVKNKQTILFHAAANGKGSRIQQLIAAEYDISERDAFGRTAYDVASDKETRKVLRDALKSKISDGETKLPLEVKDGCLLATGEQPLHEITRWGCDCCYRIFTDETFLRKSCPSLPISTLSH